MDSLSKGLYLHWFCIIFLVTKFTISLISVCFSFFFFVEFVTGYFGSLCLVCIILYVDSSEALYLCWLSTYCNLLALPMWNQINIDGALSSIQNGYQWVIGLGLRCSCDWLIVNSVCGMWTWTLCFFYSIFIWKLGDSNKLIGVLFAWSIGVGECCWLSPIISRCLATL